MPLLRKSLALLVILAFGIAVYTQVMLRKGSVTSPPMAAASKQTETRGVSPGGSIMIHGILNGWGWFGPLQTYWDWTNGCIAVTNKKMREIWSLVPNGTPIAIQE